MSTISIDPGFEGSPPAWYYLDRKAGKLSSSLPAGSPMATAANVAMSLWPRFLNAPEKAVGSNDKTQFKGRAKPNAYLKIQITQDRAGAGAMKPLTWAAMYPILDGPLDDIGNKFFDDPVSGDPVENVPIPSGTGKIQTPLAAVVGGQKPNKMLDIVDKVLGLGSTSAGKAVFPIPAADMVLAANIESLVNLAGSAFASETRQQFWLNNVATRFRLIAPEDPNDDALLLPKGTSFLVAFPDPPDHQVSNAVDTIIAKPNTTIDMDRGGVLVVKDANGVVSPNPFGNITYITFRAIVAEN